MRILSSKFTREQLITKKGTICCNCQIDKNKQIIFHHIVPLSIVGQDVLSNIVPICNDCHQLLHHNTNKIGNFEHSKLVKAGMQKAKENGVRIGRKTVEINDLPSVFTDIYYPKIKSKTISIAQAARELEMSRTTIYKYISIIEKTL